MMFQTMRVVVAAALFAVVGQAHALVINGAITDSDHLTVDSIGTFYIDYFTFQVATDSSIDVSMQTAGPMQPYMALNDPAASGFNFPVANWEGATNVYNEAFFASGPTSTNVVDVTFTALAGVTYEVALTSQTYADQSPSTSFGDYVFSINGVADQDLTISGVPVSTVPVPAPLGLALLGLALLRGRRHR